VRHPAKNGLVKYDEFRLIVTVRPSFCEQILTSEGILSVRESSHALLLKRGVDNVLASLTE